VNGGGDQMFLAVELNDVTRHDLAAHLEASLDGELLPGRTVRPHNWHLTLRFLGPTRALERDRVLAFLDQHLTVDPFRIRFTGLGGFPRESKAAVLWIGVAGDVVALDALATICETAAQEAGFEPEGRPFHPHLTVSRVRPPIDIRPLVDRVELFRVACDVTAVTLYRSVLGQGQGPAQYEVVDTVTL
jgi:2'-5' RNA ligase